MYTLTVLSDTQIVCPQTVHARGVLPIHSSGHKPAYIYIHIILVCTPTTLVCVLRTHE